jgi:hypothetical protein
VAGEKKKIGPRARRAWEERQRPLPPRAEGAARKLIQ